MMIRIKYAVVLTNISNISPLIRNIPFRIESIGKSFYLININSNICLEILRLFGYNTYEELSFFVMKYGRFNIIVEQLIDMNRFMSIILDSSTNNISYCSDKIHTIYFNNRNNVTYVNNEYMHGKYAIIFNCIDNDLNKYYSTSCVKLVYDKQYLIDNIVNFTVAKCSIANYIKIVEIIKIGLIQIFVDENGKAYRNYELVGNKVVIDKPYLLSNNFYSDINVERVGISNKVETNILPCIVSDILHIDYINATTNIFDINSSVTIDVNNNSRNIIDRFYRGSRKDTINNREKLFIELKKAVNKILLFNNSLEFENNFIFTEMMNTIISNYENITTKCISVDMDTFKFLCMRYLGSKYVRSTRFNFTIPIKSISESVIFNAKIFFNIDLVPIDGATYDTSIMYKININNFINEKISNIVYKKQTLIFNKQLLVNFIVNKYDSIYSIDDTLNNIYSLIYERFHTNKKTFITVGDNDLRSIML